MRAVKDESGLPGSDRPCMADGTDSSFDFARLFDGESQRSEVVRSEEEQFVRRRLNRQIGSGLVCMRQCGSDRGWGNVPRGRMDPWT